MSNKSFNTKLSLMIPIKKSDLKMLPKTKRMKKAIFRYLMVFKKLFEDKNGELDKLDIR
jgi:hypothetical protein